MEIAYPYGVLTLEAKWLVPAEAIPGDVAKDPMNALIAVTFELREHAIAHAARVLRESGVTPAQMKVGIGLALGKTKPLIADELGIQLSSVAGLTKKLYQNSQRSQFRGARRENSAGRNAPNFAARWSTSDEARPQTLKPAANSLARQGLLRDGFWRYRRAVRGRQFYTWRERTCRTASTNWASGTLNWAFARSSR